MVRISKTLVAGISALAMAAAVVLPTTPASAGGWRAGGFHGGGFMAAAGMAAAGTAAAGAVAAFGMAATGAAANWYDGWWGPAIAAGVIGGAAIASYPYWGGGYGYGYGGGCWQVRPTYDAYGNFLGQQSVNVC